LNLDIYTINPPRVKVRDLIFGDCGTHLLMNCWYVFVEQMLEVWFRLSRNGHQRFIQVMLFFSKRTIQSKTIIQADFDLGFDSIKRVLVTPIVRYLVARTIQSG